MPEVRDVFTLAAGNNSLKNILAAASADISMQGTWLRWRVIGPGDIAKGDVTMTALTDGDTKSVGEGDTEQAYGTDRIDFTLIYFRPTTGGVDKIFIEARSA
jgi:hypothetical protein